VGAAANNEGLVRDGATDDELVSLFGAEGVNHDRAAHFRGRLERRLLMNRCRECATWHNPPRPLCPRCWSTAVEAAEVQGTGTVHLLVLFYQGSPAPGVDYSAGPHPVATVELDEQPGLRFTTAIVDEEPNEIRIGDRVALDWIERTNVPLPVFRTTKGQGV
jgi:uncharacterized OB-fold protein